MINFFPGIRSFAQTAGAGGGAAGAASVPALVGAVSTGAGPASMPFDPAARSSFTIAELPVFGRFDTEGRKAVVDEIIFDPDCDNALYFEGGKLTLNFRTVPAIVKGITDRFHFDFLPKIRFPKGAHFEEPVEFVLFKANIYNRMDILNVGADVTIGKNVTIAKRVTIGDGCVIGDNSEIYIASEIGKGVKIGDNTKIKHIVKIGDGTEIGPCAHFPETGRCEVETIIGKNVRIGRGLFCCDRSVNIGDDVTIGNDVTIAVYKESHPRIGKGAVIEDLVELRMSVEDGGRVRMKDSSDPDKIYRGKKWHLSPASITSGSDPWRGMPFHLPGRARRMISNFERISGRSFTFNTSERASRAIGQELSLFLYPHMRPYLERKFVHIQGEKNAVVFYCDPNGHMISARYFGADEISSDLITESWKIDAQERSRLARFSKIMSNVITAQKAYEKIRYRAKEAVKEAADRYAVSRIDELYILLNFLRNRFHWGDFNDSSRFLDIGSGMGEAVKVASLFMKADGVERNRVLFDEASRYLPGRRGILINPLARTNIKLYHADLFDFDLSPYDAFYLHIAFPFAGNQNEMPKPHQFDTPYAERLRKKLEGLKSGSLIIMGPVKLECEFGAAYFTREIGDVILSNMKRLELKLPAGVSHYAVYRRP